MKQLKLMKTLLVAVGLCVGASAWAQTTLYEKGTTGNDWTSDEASNWVMTTGTEGVSSCSVREGTNNLYFLSKNTSNNNHSEAYAFTRTITSPGTDTKLTLTATWNPGDASGGNRRIASLTYGDVAFRFQGQDGICSIKIGSNDAVQLGSTSSDWRSKDWTITLTVNQSTKAIAYDVTINGSNFTGSTTLESLSTYGSVVIALSGEVNWGMSQTLKSLKITEEDAPSTAEYTVNFVNESNGVIKTAEVRSGDIGDAITITSEDKASFFDDDVKYVYKSDDSEGKIIGTDDEVTIVFREADTYTYTVNAVDGSSNILATIASGSYYADETILYAYPRYVNVNGTLYSRGKGSLSNHYQGSFSLNSNGKVVNLTYTASSYTNVVYFKEGEDILTKITKSGNSSRCSNMAAGYTSSAKKILTLPAGKYTIGFASYTNGQTFTVYKNEAEDTNKLFSKAGSGYWEEWVSEEITLDEASDILVAGGSSSYGMDYIFITGTPDNEIVGALDYSTGFMGAAKSMTISQGQTINLTFNNHGNGEQNYYNWLVRLTGTDVNHTFRADNFVLGTANSTISITEDDGDINWTDFLADMQDASVDMTITYTTAGNFSIEATSTGASHTYVHNFAYNDAKSGDITVELGVEKAWLEVKSVASTSVGITITDAGWASFSNAYEVAIPAGVIAYYASASSASSVTLTPIEGDYIPANTGVILNGDEGIYSATVTSTDASIGDNLLKPWLTAGTPEDATYYTLGVADSKPVFMLSKGGTLAAGKAYLVLPTSARELSVVFDNETNGIQQVESAAQSKGAYYNLAGQRVAQPAKGLYIVNGKKVVIK